MDGPIESIMHNESQLNVARLQDTVIEIIFDNINAVLHGGTAIWRCYNGKRFSEDIDLYIAKEADIKKITNRIALSELHIVFNRRRRGTIYYDISTNEADISLQMRIVKKKGFLVSYEKVNGVKTEIYSLTPEILIEEKIAAYNDRKFIRDIYDIMLLTKFISDRSKNAIIPTSFLSHIQKPKDESVLKNLVYSGPIPSFEEMVDYLRRWCAI